MLEQEYIYLDASGAEVKETDPSIMRIKRKKDDLVIYNRRRYPSSFWNNSFFTEIGKRSSLEFLMTGYHITPGTEGADTCLLLQSRKENIPLIAMKAQLSKGEGIAVDRNKVFGAQGTNTPHFEWILNANDVELGFTMMNLTDSFVKIDIYKQPKVGECCTLVDKKDPGPFYTINQINEIAPHRCYTCIADQSADSRSMIIKERKGGKKTIDMEKWLETGESKAGKNEEAPTFFFIDVTPVRGGQHESLFKDAEWVATTSFVYRDEEEFSDGESSDGGEFGDEEDDVDGLRNQEDGVVERRHNEEEEECSDDGLFDTGTDTDTEADCNNAPEAGSAKKDFAMKEFAMKGARATEIEHGDVVHVHSGRTNQRYSYDNRISAPLKLGISVFPGLELEFSWGSALVSAWELLERTAARVEQPAPAPPDTVYPSTDDDVCCICLGASEQPLPPLVVLLKCGHKCMCLTCYKTMMSHKQRRCVLCRMPLSGYWPGEDSKCANTGNA